MKQKFTETQIVSTLKKLDQGFKTSEVARDLGVSRGC